MSALTPLQREKITRSNFFKMIAEGATFWMALAFIEPTAVVAIFIDEYTGSMQLAGLAMSLRQAGMIIGMFVMGMFMHRIRDNGHFLRRWGVLFRLSYWIVLPPLLLGLGGEPMVILFLIAQASFFLLDGSIALCWHAINANTIHSRDRGPIQGYQQMASAVIGFLSAAAIKFLMDSDLPPNIRYAVIFGCCALIFTVNGVVLGTLKDIPSEDNPPPPRSFSRYIVGFVPLWKENKEFRRIVYGRVLFSAGVMATSLLALFGSRVVGLSAKQLSGIIYVQIAGQLLGGLFWGTLNRYMGNVRTIAICNLPSLALGALGLFFCFAFEGTGQFWPVALLVFIGSSQAVAFMGFQNSIYDRMQKPLVPAYMVLLQLVLLPFTALPYFAGLIAQQAGFVYLFALVLVFAAAGCIYCLAYAKDFQKTAPPSPGEPA